VSAGLFGLLDDVAALARLAAASVDDVGAAAAKATAKATGVVIDDTAVTPQYVRGLAAEREVPIVKRIAKGSLRNKLLVILPLALLMSQFAEWLLTPILMLGGTYLCYEAAHKIHGALFGHGHADAAEVQRSEDEIVSSAVRTDLILSAEIMVLSLNEVASEGFWSRLSILLVVAFVITAVVYGVVALIVKMDDAGLALAQRGQGAVAGFGRGLVRAMPKVLTVLSVVGTAAMLWVGGHILLVGVDDLGWHGPYELVHHVEEAAHDAVSGVGAVLGWLANTAASAVVGLVVGVVVLGVVMLVQRLRGAPAAH
jgi:predicted DNA repair protein MutK